MKYVMFLKTIALCCFPSSPRKCLKRTLSFWLWWAEFLSSSSYKYMMFSLMVWLLTVQLYIFNLPSSLPLFPPPLHLLISSDFGMIPTIPAHKIPCGHRHPPYFTYANSGLVRGSNKALSTLQIDLVLIVRESSINRNRRMDTIFMLSMWPALAVLWLQRESHDQSHDIIKFRHFDITLPRAR